MFDSWFLLLTHFLIVYLLLLRIKFISILAEAIALRSLLQRLDFCFHFTNSSPLPLSNVTVVILSFVQKNKGH